MLSIFIKYTVNTILFCFIGIGILVVFSFVPFPGNYKIFTVQSGSMEPAIHTGSLIFVKPLETYSIGDIVTRKTLDSKVTVTHRIVELTTNEQGQVMFRTQGDANNAEDSEIVDPTSIVGKTFLTIPFLGYPVSYAKTQQGLLLLIIIPAVIIIYEELQKIKTEVAKKIRYRNSVKKRIENQKDASEVFSAIEKEVSGESKK